MLGADPRTDEQLVDAMNRGDLRAFDTLYARYRDWTVSLAYRITQDHAAAMDVMQEAFLYVLGKVPGFELRAKFTTFLYPVVRHLAIAYRKKQRREPTLEQLPDRAAEEDSAGDIRSELAAVLANLSEDHRETLLLRFVDGFSLEEIAEAMQTPIGTVKSRMHHAIRTLRTDARLAEYFRGQ